MTGTALVVVDLGDADLVVRLVDEIRSGGADLTVRAILTPAELSGFGWTAGDRVVLAGRDPQRRADGAASIQGDGGPPALTLVHPSATLGSDVELGAGSVVAAGARVTTNVRAGAQLWVGEDATLSHDGRFGDWVTIGRGANVTGNCTVGDRSVIGDRSVLLPGVRLASDVQVGAGSVVLVDVSPAASVAGVPAEVVDPVDPVG